MPLRRQNPRGTSRQLDTIEDKIVYKQKKGEKNYISLLLKVVGEILFPSKIKLSKCYH